MLSLVTGTLNRPEGFRRLLDSIIANTSIAWELVVGDATNPQSYTLDVPDNVVVLHENPRLGHSKGYNAAFRACRGEWIIWLNDDAEVCPNYDIEAINFMVNHPKIGLGALHYSQNNAEFHVNSAWNVIYANFGVFRKSVGEEIGFFDEDIVMYGADNSIVFRMLLAGYGVADIPNAKIMHNPVNDQVRRENQEGRHRDNMMLQAKYMPLRRQWHNTYRQHLIESHIRPWPHGVPEPFPSEVARRPRKFVTQA